MERSLYKEKDFLSPGVRDPCILAEFPTPDAMVSFYIKGLPFTMCEESFYSGRVSAPGMERSL